MLQDYKLAIRMLLKYPGLTIAGGLALTIAIALSAGWYDNARGLLRPAIPLPGGERLVEIELRNTRGTGDERRLLHDFLNWRRDLRTVEELGAYQTFEVPLVLGGAAPQSIVVAEISASAFRLVQVPPILGRPLIEADEAPGAPKVVVIGYYVWQRLFGGSADVIGRTVRLGTTSTSVVGVMPEGFAFPVNHRIWVPIQLRASGYAPLEGPPIRVFGRVASGATQAQANVEVATLTERMAVASPETHKYLTPRVLAYGGESPGDMTLVEFAVTHGPILLVLLVACTNVGTLIYARTATREAEIAMRFAVGASRGRIVTQLFVEALVLVSLAALVGLPIAHVATKYGASLLYGGDAPFWIDPGLKPTTIIFTIVLAAFAAAVLSVLPAIKATSAGVQTQIRNMGVGGSTLRFGRVWTGAMIAQVAITVVCVPPAWGISEETLRDRRIRSAFPAQEYLGVTIELDREAASTESDAAFTDRREQMLGELERRLLAEPGVRAVTFADRLPGMNVSVRRVQVETAPGASPTDIPNVWRASVASTFFAAFDRPIVAGRNFDERDVKPTAQTVIVNEAFARQYHNGGNPVGLRVRDASDDPALSQPWFEVVGMVRDVGMTPTDRGEAAYVFHAARRGSVATVMGVRTAGDPKLFAARLRTIVMTLDQNLRIAEAHPLDEWAWRVDLPAIVVSGTLAFVVALGLFLSAAGVFSLMSVTVARRTREIGLRTALGAHPGRVMASIFSRAALLVGSGVAIGNLFLILVFSLDGEVPMSFFIDALQKTSALMMTVGLLACVEPARRALKIQPTEALREM